MPGTVRIVCFFLLLWAGLGAAASSEGMAWVQVSENRKGFVLQGSGQPFVPWGFNYDHDSRGRLLEDYWNTEWKTVEAHFDQMKMLGANVVRIHLQFGKFMEGPEQPNVKALDRLEQLVRLAETRGALPGSDRARLLSQAGCAGLV